MIIKKFIASLFILLISCSLVDDIGNVDFTQHVDSNNLRIFGKEDVSFEFLNKVAQSYDAMLGDGQKIDQSMRSKFLLTSKYESFYASVGLEASFSKNEQYAHNAVLALNIIAQITYGKKKMVVQDR